MDNYDLNISILEIPLTLEDKENRLIFGHNDNYQYHSVIIGREYGFETPDLMKGLMTRALCAGVDRRTY